MPTLKYSCKCSIYLVFLLQQSWSTYQFDISISGQLDASSPAPEMHVNVKNHTFGNSIAGPPNILFNLLLEIYHGTRCNKYLCSRVCVCVCVTRMINALARELTMSLFSDMTAKVKVPGPFTSLVNFWKSCYISRANKSMCEAYSQSWFPPACQCLDPPGLTVLGISGSSNTWDWWRNSAGIDISPPKNSHPISR